MKSKYFSHRPASLLEGPFGPHKIVIPKFWINDSDDISLQSTAATHGSWSCDDTKINKKVFIHLKTMERGTAIKRHDSVE